MSVKLTRTSINRLGLTSRRFTTSMPKRVQLNPPVGITGAARQRLKIPVETYPLVAVMSIAFVGGVTAIANHFWNDQEIRIKPTAPHAPTVDTVKAKAEEVTDTIEEKTEEVGDTVKDKAKEIRDKVRDQVAEHNRA